MSVKKKVVQWGITRVLANAEHEYTSAYVVRSYVEHGLLTRYRS